MTFRQLNQVYLVPLAQIVMIFGIVALCQPWIEVLHRFGLTIALTGLVAFMVVTKIPPEAEDADDDEEDLV